MLPSYVETFGMYHCSRALGAPQNFLSAQSYSDWDTNERLFAYRLASMT